jgi:hypothetical protein
MTATAVATPEMNNPMSKPAQRRFQWAVSCRDGSEDPRYAVHGINASAKTP